MPENRPVVKENKKVGKDTYTSHAAANILGVHVNTLRKWEEEGIIDPPSRTPGGHRRYKGEDLEKIAAMGELPLNTAESVADKIQRIRHASDELTYLHYSQRFTDPEILGFLADSVDNPDQLSMRGTIGVTDAILALHVRRLSEQTSESAAAWRGAIAAFNDLRTAQRNRDTGGVSEALERLEAIFKRRRKTDHEDAIREWQDHRARLVRTEMERLAKGGEYLTAEDAMRVAAEKLQVVLGVVRRKCPKNIQKEIIDAIREKQSDDPTS